MRILMVNYEYPPLGGGGGVMAAALARRFVLAGHEVDYITTHFAGFAREEVIDGVRVFREPVPLRSALSTASIFSMLCFPAAAWFRGRRLGRRVGGAYDLVHTHFAIPSGPGGKLISRSLGVPNVLSVYGGDIYDPSKSYSPHRQPVLRRVVRSVLNQASLVIGESEDICRRTVEIYSPTTPVERIPLGYEPLEFSRVPRQELGLREGRLYAAALCRLVSRKRLGDLIRGLHRSQVPDLDLLFIGDGPEEASLRELARELGLADRVVFTGAKYGASKYQLLAASDVFALTSDHEGFGIVFLEAMHCGLPILTSNVGGQTDFLKDGVNGILVAPRDVDAIAAALRRLAGDEALRGRMREQNLRDVEEHTMEHAARRYLDAFEGVLSRRA